MSEKKRIAIVPGSFDPITNGHVALVAQAAQRYDTVYLAVMINRAKQYLFTMEQRKQIAHAAVRHFSNVEVIASDGMLWELARSLGACAIVKGYRNEKDLAYEQEMEAYNRARYPEAETILLPSDTNLREVSSTVVRAKILAREDLHAYLPAEAIDEIYKILPRQI